MKVNFKGELRQVVEKDYDFNGQQGKSYSLTVEVEDGSYYMKTTKEIYELYKNGYLVKGQNCEFVADYSPQFKSFRIIDVM